MTEPEESLSMSEEEQKKVSNEGCSPLFEPKKEELIDDFVFSPIENETSNQSAQFLKEPKEEPIEDICCFSPIDNNEYMEGNDCKKEEIIDSEEIALQYLNLPPPSPLKDEPFDDFNHENQDKNEVEDEEEIIDNSADIPKIKKEREDEEEIIDKSVVIQKKRKLSNTISSQESASKKERVLKENDTELKCPECEYSARYVNTLVCHLSRKHSTTPVKAGLAFLCQCGHESQGDYHSKNCDISNFTIVRKGNGITLKPRLSKINDTELKCPNCEHRTRSVCGWTNHLRRVHGTTPALAGFVLRCECGKESYGDGHSKKCYSSNITIIRLDDDMTSQPRETDLKCTKCDFFTSSADNWLKHLRHIHSTTPIVEGLALLCECGYETYSSAGISDHKCAFPKFTVIRKKDEPIGRLADKKYDHLQYCQIEAED